MVHVATPSRFSVQLTDNKGDLDKMEQAMEAQYGDGDGEPLDDILPFTA